MSTSVHSQSPGQPGSDRREAHHDTLARQTGAEPIDHPALETPVETPSQRGGLDKVVFGVTAAIVPGVEVDDGVGTLLLLSAVLSLINLSVGTVLRLVTIPLRIITLGLISVVIDTAVLALTAQISDSLSIDGFWPALVAALLITAVSGVLHLIFLRDDRGR